LLLAKIITAIALGADKIQDQPLNQPLIAPNSCKNPMKHSQQGVSGLWPWEKRAIYLFIFLLPTNKSQSINQNQILLHPGPLVHGKPLFAVPH
jgi:hypothetical protein